MFVSAMYMIQYVHCSNIQYCTLIKKVIQTFLIYKEIQKESVAKSNMTNALLIYFVKYCNLSHLNFLI
jgi:hypothetical protein